MPIRVVVTTGPNSSSRRSGLGFSAMNTGEDASQRSAPSRLRSIPQGLAQFGGSAGKLPSLLDRPARAHQVFPQPRLERADQHRFSMPWRWAADRVETIVVAVNKINIGVNRPDRTSPGCARSRPQSCAPPDHRIGKPRFPTMGPPQGPCGVFRISQWPSRRAATRSAAGS